uniref:sulfatase-like hydrolase/transferase n=1 Tax=Prosthecobacter sp. TaxID=1965333 RepID=UPI0037852066
MIYQCAIAFLWFAVEATAATLKVPDDFKTIQSAIDTAKTRDIVLVVDGTYREPMKLKPGVIVRSAGNEDKGKLGLKRAEMTILEGGVEMADRAVLDGFTVTGVGKYDEKLWQHHFDTQGNEQSHEHIGAAGVPGIAVAVTCEVKNNIVHHIGCTGIAITAGSPRIIGNVCYHNMGGGIGSMSDSTAVIEKNLCFENFYAGIGCDGASPLIQDNECHTNIRAGIGISEGSSPKVAGNRCFKNRRAGIGIRTGAETRPVVEANECRDNDMAGIGVEEGARPTLTKNKLTNNKLVAIGISGGSEAIITENDISREGGAPPMIAVLEKSSARIAGNKIRGGGVAGVLVKGKAAICDNHFIGSGPKANNAIWAHAGAEVTLSGNRIEGWKHEISAAKDAKVFAGEEKPAARPNILWLTTEDMSQNLGCYGDAQAITPRLDALAREAVRFTNAFATAPVCSPSRSCLITGMFATSLGTQRLRSAFPVPAEFGPFTAELRAAGYYCSNNVKTDYNLRDEPAFIRAAWDDSSVKAHWRNRRAGQPFFSVVNFMTTHQSRTSAWPHEQFEKEIGSKLSPVERHDPARMMPPPFYPDTDESHRAWARYHDCISLMDQQAGEILDQLAADGLADDTIVFFYSDHGMGMPRGKRCLQDSGLRVPLLVRFPKKWAHLDPSPPGSVNGRLVSFVDFAPTVLSLCGVKAPAYFQGSAFLGPDAATPNEFVHGARDRVDEAFDVSRSVRDTRWLYIRNYMPHLSWMQPEGYSDTSTFRQEFKRLAAEVKLSSGPLTYAAPHRALEELYDTQTDPDNLHNLAADPQHRAVLEKMRTELRRWQLSTRYTGFLTEPQMWTHIKSKETAWSIAHDDARYPLTRILDAADAVGRADAAPRQREWLRDSDDGVRYWAAVGLHARDTLADVDRKSLRTALSDASPVVRIEAAAALARHGDAATALPVLTAVLSKEHREIVLHAARSLELLGPAAQPAHDAMRAALVTARVAEKSGDPIAMFIRFSLEAALSP